MHPALAHPERIHPDLWTYTRGGHSFGTSGWNAFVGGVDRDSSFRCMRTSNYIVPVFNGSDAKYLTYRTCEPDVEHRPPPLVQNLAMTAFVQSLSLEVVVRDRLL